MKHLIVDARAALPQVDGLGTYLRQIVPRICVSGEQHGGFRTTLLASPAMESFWREHVPAARVIASRVRPMWPGQNWQIPRLVKPLRPDLFFYPAHDPPLMLKAPLLFTIHDLSPFQVRPYFERMDRLKTSYLRWVTSSGLRRARAVMAVSNATRRAVGEIFGDDLLPKVYVTPNGIDPPRLVAPLSRDRLLYVGTDRPHKNLGRVIEAYALARADAPDVPPMEIVGGLRSPGLLNDAMRRVGVEDRVVLRGHISAEELEACYARAVGLLFPSLAEGFGLPILEAMARGVPVITSNLSACAEVAGDAALMVNPFEVREITAAMVRIFRDPDLRTELARKGHQRASEFSWERTAAQTLDLIYNCLAGRQTRMSAPPKAED